MKARGFTLIEMLVASLIIMLGVTGYVSLQNLYIKKDSQTNLRAIAVKAAQEKLEDLRSFTSLNDDPNAFDYGDIGDNSGGDLAAGDIAIELTDEQGNSYTFNRTWTVTDQYFVDTDGDDQDDTWLDAGDPDLPQNLPSWPTQKMVTVTIGWKDNQGESHSLSLEGTVAPVLQSDSRQAMNESANAKKSPEVEYVPGQAPDVISYDLGNNEKVETSKPVPDVKKQGDNIEVQFETIKYIEQDEVSKLEQEDFLTVNCRCQLAGTAEGMTPYRTVLEDDELQVEPGQTVSKMTGKPADSQQPALCDACCQDHHDTVTMISEGNYYRAEDGGPHKHYNYSGGSYSLASSVGDTYVEACRFKRVDGLFKLYPDWRLVDIVAFDDTYLFSDANLNAYKSFTESAVKNSIKGLTSPAKPSGRDIVVPPGGYQIIARGIYVDRMTNSHQQAVINKINAGDETWKAITPFYDINLTLLANWSTGDPSVASITQEAVSTIVDPENDFYGTYSRGRLEALTDGSTNISVTSYPYNAGITATTPVSPDENDNTRTDDSMQVEVDGQATSEKFFGLIGDIKCTAMVTKNNTTVEETCETNNTQKASYVDLSSMSIVADPNNFKCSVSVPKGNSTPFYSCDKVSENWNGSITFNFSSAKYTVTMKLEYPDGSIVESDTLTFIEPLNATSNREYNLILKLE
ncbi:hypothetical protein HMF8227_02212 [Saliniradius amylolyticus]|uniref:Prepilin-type N-terminal cleavage/methylation domain-containing protein n=1 Tax=Saliniradius amylolyticus TaxID=2183582 RepID=A0A2S2E4U4_9ALTE|nr:prepilin-type N-terminal cleavage/methylation domain-containing protein [Saliniradius amylolyticus]AWL12665.1 hypothetical protein HMF8227_02212 [Saliniradius amylolyticus]